MICKETGIRKFDSYTVQVHVAEGTSYFQKVAVVSKPPRRQLSPFRVLFEASELSVRQQIYLRSNFNGIYC